MGLRVSGFNVLPQEMRQSERKRVKDLEVEVAQMSSLAAMCSKLGQSCGLRLGRAEPS